jgi:hypothetical protein
MANDNKYTNHPIEAPVLYRATLILWYAAIQNWDLNL